MRKKYTVIPEELDYLNNLAEALMKLPEPRREMDSKIHQVFFGNQAVSEPPLYTKYLDVALYLIPHGWWWHISHLEVSVCPNRPEPDIPISNATDYTCTGRPLEYKVMLWGQREALPSAVCATVLLAICALKTKAAAIRNKRMYLIQTGSGPYLVDQDGKVKDLPYRKWLNKDGKLIARDEALSDDD